jgi:cytochrome c556
MQLSGKREDIMKLMLATLVGVGVGATVVAAQNLDAIKQRREVMKTIAKASGINFKMMKGETPFDLAKVRSGLKTFEEQFPKLKGLFPEDSKSGDETDASPKIWQQRAEFEAVINKFVADANAAAGTIKDEASFKAEYPKIVNSCGNCHKEKDGFAPRLADSFKKLNQ